MSVWLWCETHRMYGNPWWCPYGLLHQEDCRMVSTGERMVREMAGGQR